MFVTVTAADVAGALRRSEIACPLGRALRRLTGEPHACGRHDGARADGRGPVLVWSGPLAAQVESWDSGGAFAPGSYEVEEVLR